MAFLVDSFNTMLKQRNGRLPVDVVVLTGVSEGEARQFVAKQRSFYETFGIKSVFMNEITNIGDLSEEGCLYFTLNTLGSIPHMNLFVEKDTTLCIKRFIKELGLYGLTEDIINALDRKDELIKMLTTDKGFNEAIINTLEEHYNSSVAMGPKDRLQSEGVYVSGDIEKWLNKRETTNIVSQSEPQPEPVEERVTVTPVIETPRVEEVASETQIPANKPVDTPVPSGADSSVTAEAHAEDKPATSEPAKTEPTEPTHEEFHDGDEHPDPLTDEEKAENVTLLNKLREAYEDCKNAVEDSCNSLFVPIKNVIKDSLEKNVFASQLCVMYLEVSQDTSTILYKKLYNTDKLTEEFNNNIHRQTLKMGCPGCGHQWYEDITFLENGVHEIRCPKCDMSRLIEK